jgi:hypothetical protein
MEKKFYSKENLKFLMYDVHKTEELFEFEYSIQYPIMGLEILKRIDF